MKKFINDTDNIVKEELEGFAFANSDIVKVVDERIVVNKNLVDQERVTVLSIGGTGHEPCAIGFVGDGMLDVFVGGEIFTAPGISETIKGVELADRGKGVLMIILNHAGDLYTGNAVLEECKKKNIQVRMVVTQDDISNAPRSMADDRRGLVGCVPAYKIAGAAAMMGKSLDEIAEITQRFADNIATLAVGVKGATHPITGKLLAELADDEMEIGMGQHGEEGGGRQLMRSADETAVIMLEALLQDLAIKEGDRVMLILDGTGATTLMELFIVYRKCYQYLQEHKITIVANKVGELLTVQDAAGFQMMIAKMDDELIDLWKAPCKTTYFI